MNMVTSKGENMTILKSPTVLNEDNKGNCEKFQIKESMLDYFVNISKAGISKDSPNKKREINLFHYHPTPAGEGKTTVSID